MTPASYLRLVVLPCLDEMIAEPESQRRAYVACITAAHLVDHVDAALGSPKDGKRDVRVAVRAVGRYSAACMDIVEAVATGAKHAKADPRASRAVKYAPGHERFIPPLAYDAGSVGYDDGRLDLPGGIVVDHAGGHWFIDDSVRTTVRAYATAFPALFADVDLGHIAREFDRYAAFDAIPDLMASLGL